jgi:hypothetical protein
MAYDKPLFKINLLSFAIGNISTGIEKRISDKASITGNIKLKLTPGNQALFVSGGARYYYGFGKNENNGKKEGRSSLISGNYFQGALTLGNRYGMSYIERGSGGFYLTPSITTGIQRSIGRIGYFDANIGYEFGRPNYGSIEYRLMATRSFKTNIALGICF